MRILNTSNSMCLKNRYQPATRRKPGPRKWTHAEIIAALRKRKYVGAWAIALALSGCAGTQLAKLGDSLNHELGRLATATSDVDLVTVTWPGGKLVLGHFVNRQVPPTL
ncbi:MAG TPA: hypothetical protein VMQ76_09610 [Terracidiphilus sp.]|nr:hypothetical protein [Terracidiphilus sp.]